MGLPDELRRDWTAYQGDWATFEARSTAARAEMEVDAGAQADLPPEPEPDLAVVSDPVLDAARAAAAGRTEKAASALRDAINVTGVKLASIIDERSRLVADVDLEPRDRAVATLQAIGDENERLLRALAAELNEVRLISGSEGIFLTSSELASVADTDLLDLRVQLDRALELAQLGLAVEVVSHEFRATVATIRAGLDQLAVWGKRNPELGVLHRDVSGAFEHLDNYLTLFTPLQRRTRVEPTEMIGAEIHRFLVDLFADRLAASEIDLVATDAFREHRFLGRPSVFYPVFVNLVDNAIFWVTDHPQPRLVRLDADEQVISVEDSGPGVPRRDREAIFEPGSPASRVAAGWAYTSHERSWKGMASD